VKLLVAAVGKVRKSYLREGCEDYFRRIRKMTPIDVKEVKPAGGNNPSTALKTEGKKIRTLLDGLNGWKIAAATDKGKTLTSNKFAELLGKVENGGATGMVIVVGGAWGLDEEVVARADYKIGFGPMTMSHELARLVLFEQIYRAQTILRGVPYSK